MKFQHSTVAKCRCTKIYCYSNCNFSLLITPLYITWASVPCNANMSFSALVWFTGLNVDNMASYSHALKLGILIMQNHKTSLTSFYCSLMSSYYCRSQFICDRAVGVKLYHCTVTVISKYFDGKYSFQVSQSLYAKTKMTHLASKWRQILLSHQSSNI